MIGTTDIAHRLVQPHSRQKCIHTTHVSVVSDEIQPGTATIGLLDSRRFLEAMPITTAQEQRPSHHCTARDAHGDAHHAGEVERGDADVQAAV
jgi:hypothetical protein